MLSFIMVMTGRVKAVGVVACILMVYLLVLRRHQKLSRKMKIFAGSEVSIFTLEKAYSAGVTPEQSQTLINQAALAEFMRGLGFVPLIATTALATGVYAVAGFTFVYAVGYLSPNPMVAAVLGAVVISAEVLLLRSIGKWLGRYPSVRNASDNIRNAMNMLMEVALLSTISQERKLVAG